MDPVTQGIFGALTAQAGARRTQARMAATAGAAAGMAPDLDVLIRSADDSLLAIEYHRHFTHALAFIPIGALIVALVLWWPFRRWRPGLRFARLYAWCLLGVASHGVLDAMTSYGTRLFWPFSDDRVAWNIISVIDPLFTLPVLVLLALGVWRFRRPLVAAAAVWAALYFSAGAWQHQRAKQAVLEWANDHRIEAVRVVAKPAFANLLLWRGLTDDGAHLRTLAVRVPPGAPARIWPGPRVARFESSDGTSPVDSRLARDLRRFRHFSSDWAFEAPSLSGDRRRFVGDFRYAIDPASSRPLWGIWFDPERPEQGARFDRLPEVPEQERKAFFARLAGRDPEPAAAPAPMAAPR